MTTPTKPSEPTGRPLKPAPHPPDEPHGGGVSWGWILLCGLLLAGGAFWWLRRGATDAAAAPPAGAPAGGRGGRGGALGPVGVAMATVRTGEVGVYVTALGAVTPIYTVSIKPRVDGELLAINYTEGQLIKKGDPLVDIDPRPYQALLLQAQGQYDRDKAQLKNAQLDLDRYKEAFAKNAIPKQTLDTQYAIVDQYSGAVKFDQGQIDTAKVNLSYCHVTAPIDGRVGLRLVDPGNVVHASDVNPLVVITQLEPIAVTFGVDENYLPQILGQVKLGKKLSVEAYDHEDTNKLADGTLLTFDNLVDPNSGTVKFKALFANADGGLFPNQFVNARLLVDTQHGAVVPTSAVQHNAQGAFLYLVKTEGTNKSVAMQPVKVGAAHAGQTIVEGVKPGDQIAADNFNRLQDGQKVFERPAGARGGGGRGGAGSGGERGGGRSRGGEGEKAGGDSKPADRTGARRGGEAGADKPQP